MYVYLFKYIHIVALFEDTSIFSPFPYKSIFPEFFFEYFAPNRMQIVKFSNKHNIGRPNIKNQWTRIKVHSGHR